MFLGHFALGLASKNIDKRPSLGTYFLAAQFLDLLWPIFLLLGIEHVVIDPGNTKFTPLNFVYYPFSHSLLGALIWSACFGIIYYLVKKNYKASILLGALVFSHWILDLFTHRPDLPLTFSNETKEGMGLWNSFWLSLTIESIIYAAGVYLYFKATKAQNKKGSILSWALFIFLAAVYILNAFGPPPPDEKSIAFAGLSLWLIVAWAYWGDKNRTAAA
ncbi:MAG TPA: metal-dependent hydrolase [Ignavibacteriaceae bacterium]|nr:metal-dependent hydrolase [Ignavibacteriaceae bacterium]